MKKYSKNHAHRLIALFTVLNHGVIPCMVVSSYTDEEYSKNTGFYKLKQQNTTFSPHKKKQNKTDTPPRLPQNN